MLEANGWCYSSNWGISRCARRILRRSPSAMAAIMPSPAKPTPASAPPRLPFAFVAATGVTAALPATGPGAVLPLNVAPPPLGVPAAFVDEIVLVAAAVFVPTSDFGESHPRQNAFS